jgi:hypothetical protein
MERKNKQIYSKIILITTLSLIGLNLLLAIILPLILSPNTESLIVSTLIFQNNILLPITYIFLILP